MLVLSDTYGYKEAPFVITNEYNDIWLVNLFMNNFSFSNNSSTKALAILKQLPKIIPFVTYNSEVYQCFNRGKRERYEIRENLLDIPKDEYLYLTDMAFTSSGTLIVYVYKPEDFLYKNDVQVFFRNEMIDSILKDL